jgi:hypothetical protein
MALRVAFDAMRASVASGYPGWSRVFRACGAAPDPPELQLWQAIPGRFLVQRLKCLTLRRHDGATLRNLYLGSLS